MATRLTPKTVALPACGERVGDLSPLQFALVRFGGLAEQRLEFGKGHLDRVHVARISTPTYHDESFNKFWPFVSLDQA